jgi:hypothetical protein
MAVQHQDPLVYNAFAQNWQNASNANNPTGQPIGLAIGAPGGSSVAMLPNVGFTVQADGGPIGAILAAHQYDTASGTESEPGYIASVVFNSGAANEQLGLLYVSPLSQATAQAILQLADSADGTIHGSTKFGTIVPGTTATWSFTSAIQVLPSALTVQLQNNYQVQATDPLAGGPETWHTNNASTGSGITGGGINYTLAPVGNQAIVLVQWYYNHNSGTVTPDGTVVGNLPNAYSPTGSLRIAACTDAEGTSGGNTKGVHLRIVAGSGQVQIWGLNAASTFHAGCGLYPLNPVPGG